MLDLKSWSSLSQTNKYFYDLSKQPSVIRSLVEDNCQVPITKRIQFAKLVGSKLEKLDLEHDILSFSTTQNNLKIFSPFVKILKILNTRAQ